MHTAVFYAMSVEVLKHNSEPPARCDAICLLPMLLDSYGRIYKLLLVR